MQLRVTERRPPLSSRSFPVLIVGTFGASKHHKVKREKSFTIEMLCYVLFQLIDHIKIVFVLTQDFNFHWLRLSSSDLVFGLTAVQATIRKAGRLYSVNICLSNIFITHPFYPPEWTYGWVGTATAVQWERSIFFHFEAILSCDSHILGRIWVYTTRV